MTNTTKSEIRPYGPGKFATMLDCYVYYVSLDGGCDDEFSAANRGWYGLMRHGHTIFKDHDPLLETLNEAEQDKLTGCAGVIVREDSDGFVAVKYFDTMEALDEYWNQAVDEYRDEQDEQE